MTVEQRTSRLAGALYLVAVATGIFSLGYVPSQIVLSGDPQASINNIMASEPLFRFGIASFMVGLVAFLLLPLVLFQLLRPVGATNATLMVALATVSVPIALISLSSRLNVLSLLTDPRYVVLTPQQLQAEVLFALGEYRSGLLIAKLFWGLWLFPFGYLVFKSGFLPKVLGILLMLGCLGYLVDVFGHLLVPGYTETDISGWVLRPASVGEIGTCLWLLIVGARQPHVSAAQQEVAADDLTSRGRG